jgi:acetyltransferase-like isoleucine patch superfamily enzyme
MKKDNAIRTFKSHGTGDFKASDMASCGDDVVFEKGVMVFHPENVHIGSNVYIGHQTILKGYYKNAMYIGDNTWIGQMCFFHSAGGIRIGENVGIGPRVSILTSQHRPLERELPVMSGKLKFGEVFIGDGCDIGTGAIILPGITIGEGAIIAAGAVVNCNVPAYEIWGGIPAKKISER